MKVILETDVVGLGGEGDIVHVAPGYARNFLFPKKMAKRKSPHNIAVLESRRTAIEKRREERRKEEMSLRERLESEKITLAMRASENGHLYGAVTPQLVSEKLEEMGLHIPKKFIMLPAPSLKEVGTYTATAKLHHGMSAKFRIVVENSEKTPSFAPDAHEHSQTTETDISNDTPHEAHEDSPYSPSYISSETMPTERFTSNDTTRGAHEQTTQPPSYFIDEPISSSKTNEPSDPPE